jgi:hypothetical protein
MSRFATRKVEVIKARELVEELLIDDIGQLDLFQEELAGTTYKSELNSLLRYIEHFANGFSVGNRVTYLKGVTDNITEYEFRSKHLRIYAVQQPGSKLIMFGGTKKKADSSDNIALFRSVKRNFFASLKSKK